MSVLLGLGLGVLGSVAGNIMAGRQASKGQRAYSRGMEHLVGDYRADLAPYLSDMHRNHMESGEMQSTIQLMRDQLRRQAEAIRGGVARSGNIGDPQHIAVMTEQTDSMQRMLTGLYGQSEGLRRAARESYMGHRGAVRGIEANMLAHNLQAHQQRAANWQQWGSNMMSAGGSLAMLAAGGTPGQSAGVSPELVYDMINSGNYA